MLYIGPQESTVAGIIRRYRCGWQVGCGDTAALISLLNHLAQHRSEILESGHRARLALLGHYDRPLGVARICEVLGAAQLESSQEISDLSGSSLAKEKQFANSY